MGSLGTGDLTVRLAARGLVYLKLSLAELEEELAEAKATRNRLWPADVKAS